MKFSKVISAIVEPRIETPLSRLYGYERNFDGTYNIVHNEADVIAKVITTIGNSKDELDGELDKLLTELSGTRNRSGRRWTKTALLGLCKYIYGGVVVNDFGVLIPSKFYPNIVPLELCKKAVKKVRKYQKNE